MNKILLIGRLTKNPELRYTQQGTAITRFTLAVNKQLSKERKQEAEANNRPTADFIGITAWSKLAETIANYTRKGSLIAIEGRLENNDYEKDGIKHYSYQVIASNMEFLESAKSNNQGNSQGNNQGNQENYNIENDDNFFPIDNDDIPF